MHINLYKKNSCTTHVTLFSADFNFGSLIQDMLLKPVKGEVLSHDPRVAIN